MNEGLVWKGTKLATKILQTVIEAIRGGGDDGDGTAPAVVT